MGNLIRKKYWEENKERINRLRRENYAKNPEPQKQQSHDYYVKNQESVLEKQKERWGTVKNEINSERRNKYEEDKNYAEKAKKRASDHYYENLEQERENRRIYAQEHKAEINKYSRKMYKEFKEKVFEILGYKHCKQCNYSEDTRALQFDHIDGGGGKIRKKIGSLQQLRLLIRDPQKTKKEMQILCSNCNIIKSRTKENEFGHNNRNYKNEGKTPYKKLMRNRIGKPERLKKFKETLFNILGTSCIKCGYNKIIALQFDHKVPIRGKKNRMEAYTFYRYYSLNPELAKHDLQTLCGNCNQLKKFDNGEF